MARIIDQLVPMAPLDLSKLNTVSEIVDGMRQTAFGGRCLGEVAETLTHWIRDGKKPLVIYDGNVTTPVAERLNAMQRSGHYFTEILTSQEFAMRCQTVETVLVIGHYMERCEDMLYFLAKRAIFINNDNQCKPGLVWDGYFPDVVFADPNFVLPVLHHTLKERILGVPSTIEDLMKDLETFRGEGKTVVHGSYTTAKMLCDPDCTVMMTLSGALTVAKLQPLAVDLVESGRVKYLASTGALIGHGLIEGSGCQHFKHDPRFSDAALVAEGLNRITTAIEPETNFDHIEKIVTRVLNDSYRGKRRIITSSSQFYERLGAYLAAHHPHERAILASAFRMRVPIVTPAFTDSELANDVFVNNARRAKKGLGRIIFDQELDTGVLFRLATTAKKLGIFTIGGGVPRNNTQNVAPLINIFNARLRRKLPPGKFFYACRVDPASMFLGHLGGCTYSEGGSWGKFDLNGMLAEVRLDATIAWPFIQKFALNRFRQSLTQATAV